MVTTSSRITRLVHMGHPDPSGLGWLLIFRKSTQFHPLVMANTSMRLGVYPAKVCNIARSALYFTALCDAISHACIVRLVTKGITLPHVVAVNAEAQAFSGVRPRSTKVTPVVTEFKSRIAILADVTNTCVWHTPRPDTSTCNLLHSCNLGDCGGDVHLLSCEFQKACKVFHVDVDAKLDKVESFNATNTFSYKIFGVCWTPEEFTHAALHSKHPMSHIAALPDELLTAADFHVTKSQSDIARLRCDVIAKWTRRAIELDNDEKQLREGMDEHLRNALTGKRILLFKEWLADAGFPDMEVCDELLKGVELTGNVAQTNMLPPKYVPALLTEDMLKEHSKRVREQSLADCASSGDSGLDNTVWQKTLEEVSLGWLIGPIPLQFVDSDLPLSRRFGLVQKLGKVR